MKVLRSLLTSAGILLLATVAAPAQDVVADRAPLTFRDNGLYANLHSVHGVDPSEDGVENLLPPDRAASPTSPWDFYIMQYNAKAPDPALAETINTAARVSALLVAGNLVGESTGP